jgi:hypothetical protein
LDPIDGRHGFVLKDVHSLRIQDAVAMLANDRCVGKPRRCRIARLESWSGAASRLTTKGENMKTLFALVLVASTLAGFSAANAAGGCGPGFHRGPYGGCRPNGGAIVVAPRVVVAPAPVVVVPRARVCPYGFAWRAGRCRPI